MAVSEQDNFWMRSALQLAKRAAEQHEVPVGAVIVSADNCLLGEGANAPIKHHDPTAHAEILALRDASLKIQNYRLTGTTLYVTLEPCLMCFGAMIHARINRLVFAASDPRVGVITGDLSLLKAKQFNHHIDCSGGVLVNEAQILLKNFFKSKR